MAKEQVRKVELLRVEPKAIGLLCANCSATELQLPPATTPQSYPYVASSSELLIDRHAAA